MTEAHWITSPGLGGGLLPYKGPSPEVRHTTPIIYDVAADPAEAFPLPSSQLPPSLFDDLAAHKEAYERALAPRSIDLRWGYQWALCCGVGCTPPCRCQCADVDLPL